MQLCLIKFRSVISKPNAYLLASIQLNAYCTASYPLIMQRNSHICPRSRLIQLALGSHCAGPPRLSNSRNVQHVQSIPVPSKWAAPTPPTCPFNRLFSSMYHTPIQLPETHSDYPVVYADNRHRVIVCCGAIRYVVQKRKGSQ